MLRSLLPVLVVLICFCCTQCIKHVDTPYPEVIRRLMTRSWILAYTDTVSIDSTNTVRYIRIPATECERKEPIFFFTGINYQVHLECGQTLPHELNGLWSYSSDLYNRFPIKVGYIEMEACNQNPIGYLRHAETDSAQQFHRS